MNVEMQLVPVVRTTRVVREEDSEEFAKGWSDEAVYFRKVLMLIGCMYLLKSKNSLVEEFSKLTDFAIYKTNEPSNTESDKPASTSGFRNC